PTSVRRILAPDFNVGGPIRPSGRSLNGIETLARSPTTGCNRDQSKLPPRGNEPAIVSSESRRPAVSCDKQPTALSDEVGSMAGAVSWRMVARGCGHPSLYGLV